MVGRAGLLCWLLAFVGFETCFMCHNKQATSYGGRVGRCVLQPFWLKWLQCALSACSPPRILLKFVPPFRNTQVLRGETGERPP